MLDFSSLLPAHKGQTLTGQLLVATQAMGDPYFDKAVIYMLEHTRAGAMGLIINSPIENIAATEVFEQVNIPLNTSAINLKIGYGGPVETHRGFILHSSEVATDESIFHQNVAVSANLQIMHNIANGNGPKHARLLLGYAGWQSRQLEAEMEQGSWLIVPATQSLVFDANEEHIWPLATTSLGFDFSRLSSIVGHA